jgi:Tfp pilus assembly protein PilF
MKRLTDACRTAVVGLGLSALTGCATSPLASNFGAPPLHVPEFVAPDRPASKTELPPDQAAAVCLAAAQELEKNGHDADAIAQYERARQLNPNLPGIARRLGVLYDRVGDPARAQAEYRRALQASPRNSDLLNDIGFSHYQAGRWADAEEWFRKAVDANPKNERAWVNLGLTLAQQGRQAESLEAFGKALTPAEAHANLGLVLAANGKHPQAREAFQQALAFQPDLKLARAALATLDNAQP